MSVTWGQIIPPEAPIDGQNERCIEVPLGLELLQLEQPGWVLDAGCAMNGRLPEGGRAQVIHLTQNIESEQGHASGGKRSYVSADLRNLRIFATCAFDRAVCISTLEHVGLDNSGYKAAAESDPDSMLDAVRELCRVTTRDLLITVPFHASEQQCTRWRFLTPKDLALMIHLGLARGFKADTRYYARNDKGWYGGGLAPVPANENGFPNSVNAIAAMRLTR